MFTRKFLVLFIVSCFIIGWSGVAFAKPDVTFNIKAESSEEDMSAGGFDWTDNSGGRGTVPHQPDGELTMESVYGEFGLLFGWVNPFIIFGAANTELGGLDRAPGLWEHMDWSSDASFFYGGGINFRIVDKARFELNASVKAYALKTDDLDWNLFGRDATQVNLSGYLLPDRYDGEMDLLHCEAEIAAKFWLFKDGGRGLALKVGAQYSMTDVDISLTEIYSSGDVVNDEMNWDKEEVVPVAGVEYAFSENAGIFVEATTEKVSGGLAFSF